MTYTPTKQELEDAAIACGLEYTGEDYAKRNIGGGHSENFPWNPHLDAGDLLQMMLAADISHGREGRYMDAWVKDTEYYECSLITNGNKQAALAEAAIKVAAAVGAKMRLEKA